MSGRTVLQTVAVLAMIWACVAHAAADEPVPRHAGTRILRSAPLVVEVGDPASEAFRWNRGVRFSPVAGAVRAELNGQEFLYAPVSGGVVDGGFVGGLAMEFDIGQESFQPDPPGYDEGSNGDPFLKVGVGILRRDANPYRFNGNYPIVESATTTATWGEDRAHFVQTLTGHANGYSYRLEEDLIVKNDRIVMHYRLRNTGSKPFTTEQYIHNFLSFRGRSVGPEVRLSFPYDITTSPSIPEWTPPARGRRVRTAANPTIVRIGNMIEYAERVSSVPKVWVYKPQDYVGPDRFAIEHLGTQQRLIIESSIPATNVGIWTTNYQISPEQFVQVTVAPSEEVEFRRTYRFHVAGFVPEDSTGDETVDANDLSLTSSAWLSEPGDPAWLPAADVSSPPDDRIELHDLNGLGRRWREPSGLPAPIARWRLDETTGATAHDERGEHPGILHNFADSASHWTAGMLDGGLQFDGVDDYVEIPGHAGVIGRQARTVTAWISLRKMPASNQTILAWGQPDPGRHWLLEVDADRQLRFSCEGGYAVATAREVGDTRWHHVAAALDPLVAETPQVSDIRLYVDGWPQTVYDMAEHEIDTSDATNLRIGASHGDNPNQPFGGIIDDVRIYDRALDSSGILAILREASAP